MVYPGKSTGSYLQYKDTDLSIRIFTCRWNLAAYYDRCLDWDRVWMHI